MIFIVCFCVCLLLLGWLYMMHVIDTAKQQCSNVCPQQVCPQPVCLAPVTLSRDRLVASDELYPPLNREPLEVYTANVYAQRTGLFNVDPRGGQQDKFRLCAYMIGSLDSWKLFGRQKQRGGNLGEYYAKSTNTQLDIKIYINADMLNNNERLNDIYNLPSTLSFRSTHLFKSGEYTVTELGKSDYSSQYT